MIRKTTNGDISDEEFNAILKPFLDNYDEYIESYIMPEVIAYYIANSLVAKFLGHTKIEETLNTYSHMFSTALDSVVSVIDNLDSKS